MSVATPAPAKAECQYYNPAWPVWDQRQQRYLDFYRTSVQDMLDCGHAEEERRAKAKKAKKRP